MATTIPSFTAVWNERNVHLRLKERTRLSILFLPLAIARLVGWGIHFVAKKILLPSAWFYPHQIVQRAKRIFKLCCRNLQNQFAIQKHRIVTPVVSERSFESIRSILEQLIPPFLKPLFFWIPWAVEKEGWNIVVPFNKLKGRILVVYHPDDSTVPYRASAHQGALKAKAQFEALQLYQTEKQIAEAQERFVDHHFEDLENYYVAPGLKASHAIANFILPPPVA